MSFQGWWFRELGNHLECSSLVKTTSPTPSFSQLPIILCGGLRFHKLFLDLVILSTTVIDKLLVLFSKINIFESFFYSLKKLDHYDVHIYCLRKTLVFHFGITDIRFSNKEFVSTGSLLDWKVILNKTEVLI